MRPGAASASSIEHSSGSVFISQYFIVVGRSGSPQCRWYPAPEPWLYRVVAYRSHQARPARTGRGTFTTVTLGPQPKEAIGSESMGPVAHRREPASFLEQLLLLCNRCVDLRFKGDQAALRLPEI